MQVLVNNKAYSPFHFEKEAEFEMLVEKLADHIFGQSSIYISKKKKIKGSEIISIPDGYLIDMADPKTPALFVIENEIVSHDPFRHIGIQLLKFATSFDESKVELRKHIMNEITANQTLLSRLEKGCNSSTQRNIDSYLDLAVFGEFKALIVIDEAREELHNVIQKINADISVLELKTFASDTGDFIYQYDTLYDEDEENIIRPEQKNVATSPDDKAKRRARRALCDTIVVPAQKEGFVREFINNNQWYAIRIGAAMKEKIKYIAAYQVAPVSAITHVAEIDNILPYQNTGKYLVKFKNPATEIQPIGVSNPDKSPQGPVYIRYSDLKNAKTLDELTQY